MNSAETALMIAAENDDVDIVEFLIRRGAKIETEDCFKWTALHRAATKDAIGAVTVLLRNGANIERQGNFGWKPLHCAASRGHKRMVALLLKSGANAKAQDQLGRTAEQVTQRPDIREIIQQLPRPQSQQQSRRFGIF